MAFNVRKVVVTVSSHYVKQMYLNFKSSKNFPVEQFPLIGLSSVIFVMCRISQNKWSYKFRSCVPVSISSQPLCLSSL